MSSKAFGKKRSRREHLLRGQGLGGEVLDLRKDADEAFALVEAHVVTTADFYVNWAGGDDNNDGLTIDTAVKTYEGLMALWGPATLLPDGGILTVHVVNAPPAAQSTFALRRHLTLGLNSILVLDGPAQAERSGTFTAVTAQTRSSNTANSVTDSALGSGSAWTSDLGKRVKSGSNYMWVAKDMGSKQARISRPATLPDSTATTPALGAVNVSDAYTVESLQSLVIDEISIQGAVGSSDSQYPAVVIRNFDIQPSGGDFGTSAWAGQTQINTSCQVQFVGCHIYADVISTCTALNGILFQNCHLDEGYAFNYCGTSSWLAGLVSNSAIVYQDGAGFTSVTGDILFQGCTAQVLHGGTMVFGLAAFFDAGGGIITGYGGTLIVDASWYFNQTALWGSGASTYGVVLDSNACMLIKKPTGQYTLPTVTGSSGDFSLAGMGTGRPFNESTGAYVTAVTNTWAALAVAIASNGFNGGAHNVQLNTHVLYID